VAPLAEAHTEMVPLLSSAALNASANKEPHRNKAGSGASDTRGDAQ